MMDDDKTATELKALNARLAALELQIVEVQDDIEKIQDELGFAPSTGDEE